MNAAGIERNDDYVAGGGGSDLINGGNGNDVLWAERATTEPSICDGRVIQMQTATDNC